MKGIELRDYQRLRHINFGQDRRVLYITKTIDAALDEKARQVAVTWQLDYHYDYQYQYTGNGYCTIFLHNLCRRRQLPVAAG